MTAMFKHAMAIGLAVAALASPGLARDSGSRVRGDFGGPPYVGIEHISAARWRAIHDCSVLAAQRPDYEYGNLGTYLYRACMYAHRQPE